MGGVPEGVGLERGRWSVLGFEEGEGGEVRRVGGGWGVRRALILSIAVERTMRASVSFYS